MSFIKKISLLALSLVIFYGVFFTDKAFAVVDRPATISGFSLNAKIISISFDKVSRQAIIKFSLKNETDSFVDGIKLNLWGLKGEKLAEAGDPFSPLKYIYASTITVGALYPHEERVVEVKNIPPGNIDSGNYFFRMEFYDATFSYLGLTFNKSPQYMTGTGGFIGDIRGTFFRTPGGDDGPFLGRDVRVNDPVFIMIPLEDNIELANYIKANKVSANVLFVDATKPEVIMNNLKGELVTVSIEKGKSFIKYQLKPWANIIPEPYTVSFSLVNDRGEAVATTLDYRWWVSGFKARVGETKIKQNYYRKGDNVNVKIEPVIFDPFDEAKTMGLKLKLSLQSIDGKDFSFYENIPAISSSSPKAEVSFLDQQISEKVLINKVVASIINSKGEIIDSYSVGMDSNIKITAGGVEYKWYLEYFYYLVVFTLVILLLLLVLLTRILNFGWKTLLIITFILLLLTGISIYIYKINIVYACGTTVTGDCAQGTLNSISYDGNYLTGGISCAYCLNGMSGWWGAGSQSGWWSASNGGGISTGYHSNTLTFAFAGSGCSASFSANGSLHCTAPMPDATPWTTNFCAVNGACGVANGAAVTSKPTSNLCNYTADTATVTGNGPWSWACTGSGTNHSNASCSAPILAAPTLTANTSAGCGGYVDLFWNQVAGASSYSIYKNGLLVWSTLTGTETSLLGKIKASSPDNLVIKSVFGSTYSASSTPAISAVPSVACPTLSGSCDATTTHLSVASATTTWTATAINGDTSLTPTYRWGGSGGLLGTNATTSKGFTAATTTSVNFATTTITRGSESVTVNCPSITIKPALTTTCSSTPSSALVGQTVAWTAYPSNGSGSYTYSWTGTDSLSGTSSSVSKSYTSVGSKYATTTVRDGLSTTTVGCLGDTTLGIKVGIKGQCGAANNAVFVSAAALISTTTRCVTSGDNSGSTSTPATFLSPGPWTWTCSGKNGGQYSSTCSATQSETASTSINCISPSVISSSLSSPVNVNNNVVYTVPKQPAACKDSCLKKWSIFDNGNTSNTTTPTLNKIFTTTGQKNIDVYFSTSSPTGILYKGTSCSTTTTIVQEGGSGRER